MPVTQLHQIHSSSGEPDLGSILPDLQYSHHAGGWLCQAHGRTGLCDKKRLVRKGVSHHDRVTALSEIGIIIQYGSSRRRDRTCPPRSFRHFTADQADYIGVASAVSAHFCAIWSCTQVKALKNNIRSAFGTPVDSGRFRQAITSERIDVLTSIVVSVVKACTRFAVPTGPYRTRPRDRIGFLYSPQLRHQHRHQYLISPDLDWRKRDNQFGGGIRSGPHHPGRRRGADAGTHQHGKRRAGAEARRRYQELRIDSAARLRGVFREERAAVSPGGGDRQADRPVRLRGPPDRDHGGRSQHSRLTGALETGLAGIKRGQVKLDSTSGPST